MPYKLCLFVYYKAFLIQWWLHDIWRGRILFDMALFPMRFETIRYGFNICWICHVDCRTISNHIKLFFNPHKILFEPYLKCSIKPIEPCLISNHLEPSNLSISLIKSPVIIQFLYFRICIINNTYLPNNRFSSRRRSGTRGCWRQRRRRGSRRRWTTPGRARGPRRMNWGLVSKVID